MTKWKERTVVLLYRSYNRNMEERERERNGAMNVDWNDVMVWWREGKFWIRATWKKEKQVQCEFCWYYNWVLLVPLFFSRFAFCFWADVLVWVIGLWRR